MNTQDHDFPALFKNLHEMYEEMIPFNKILGFKIDSMDMEKVWIRINWDDKLVGNFVHKTLHGGVISAVLDATGGITASMGILSKLSGKPMEIIIQRLFNVGTIDLRVDYLRPGRGRFFKAKGSVMRTGRKVSVTRMEFYNDEKLLIAVGTGTYIVG